MGLKKPIYKQWALSDMPRLVMKSGDFFSDRVKQIRRVVADVASDAKQLQIRGQKHAVGEIVSVSDSFSSNAAP